MRTKHRNSTDQMLFLIKSDFIEHLFFYFCFFYRSFQLLFKPNQTQKKKIFQIPENKLPEMYVVVDPCPPFQIHSLQPVRRLRSRVREIAPDRDRDRRRDLAFARSRRREIATLIAISPSRDRAGEI